MFAPEPLDACALRRYAWVVDSSCTVAQALNWRGAAGRLVAGGLRVSWFYLPLTAADNTASSCAAYAVQDRDLFVKLPSHVRKFAGAADLQMISTHDGDRKAKR